MVKMRAGEILHVKLAIWITMKTEVDKIKIDYRKLHQGRNQKQEDGPIFANACFFTIWGFLYNAVNITLFTVSVSHTAWKIHNCKINSPVPVISPHKGQLRRALMFSLISAWINGWVNNLEAGDLRRNLTIMTSL